MTPHPPAVISGTGLVTPLATGVDLNWQKLLAGEFIRDHARLPGNPAEHRLLDAASCAAAEAIATANWSTRQIAAPDTALVVGTSKGPIEKWICAGGAVATAEGYGLGAFTASLALRVGLEAGYRTTLSAACASGLHALIHAVMLLAHGHAQRVLVVACEASVHPLFVGSFKRLGVLPGEGIGCRPFDESRTGFLISESAAAACLEIPSRDDPRPAVDGFSLAGDATHLTGSDPAGRALKYVLRRLVDGRGPVDLIHPHGTGTVLNDRIELDAIEAVIGSQPGLLGPSIYSHKGALGHSLGASGMVSTVLNCRMHREGIVLPNIRTSQPIDHDTLALSISRHEVKRPIRKSLALAAGFGGAIAGISIRSNLT